MKPFILLQTRPEDAAADNEYEAFLSFTGLMSGSLKRFRVHDGNFPDINLSDYSAIFIGGGPYCVSTPANKKTNGQKRFEKSLNKLLDQTIPADFPLLAACGIGAIVEHQGGIISKKYSEPVGSMTISLTHSGKLDPLTKDLADTFDVLGGHKEACEVIPPKDAVVLAYSVDCPVQILKIKKNTYLTQFHSELDVKGIILRIQIYKNYGYFPAEDADKLIEASKKHKITEPEKILKKFVELYGR